MPARVWVCITHLLTEFAMWIAEWITKPARFTG